MLISPCARVFFMECVYLYFLLCIFRRRKTMKLKELESHLGNVENFTDAKEYLEQYMTTPHLGNKLFQIEFINLEFDLI